MCKKYKIYSLHDRILFALDGEGPLYDYMMYQHRYFNVEPYDNELDILLIKISKNIVYVEGAKLQNGGEYYAIDNKNSRFIWAVNNSRMSLNGRLSIRDQCDIQFDGRFNKMNANLVVELILRSKLIDNNVALVHAACVAKNGNAVLLPAWKGMGKTSACLKLVEAGYEFLADDRVWINASGEAFAYPRYVVIKESNAAFFPEFFTRWARFTLFLYQHLAKKSDNNSKRLLRYSKRRLSPFKYAYIDELFPNVIIAESAKLAKVLPVVKINGASAIRRQTAKCGAVALVSHLINNVEWNYPLLGFAAAHDLLFPEAPSWTEELNTLMNKERRVIEMAQKGVEHSVLELPSNDCDVNWDALSSIIS